jgi:hypothetical protein
MQLQDKPTLNNTKIIKTSYGLCGETTGLLKRRMYPQALPGQLAPFYSTLSQSFAFFTVFA